ncbi:competence protein ComEA [Fibrella aestuarina BUZ 2]|uniref:Competence protein ComEA n=1 Tax=Fibrella aestuarina BUZ 2 TaxID=1166018 RepID=I0KBQ5_9BACT|nr:helix-hairpin-helix domain-containing protein [Fibrella aestuarina]CCH01558.1 competence protein ComEA [Fibrella aestuarina BUZ 2]
MKRILQEIADYFAIGYNEARGVLLLLLITFFVLLGTLLYRQFWPDTSRDTTAADQRKLDSLVALMRTEGAADEQRFREQRRQGYASRRDEDATTAEHYREVKPFPFDPNTVSVAGWQQLGLPRWLAQRIDKYRSKGGRFRKKEDLLRIYDFPPEAYEQLEAYIQLPNNVPSATPSSPNVAAGNVPTGAPPSNVPSPTATAAPTRERYTKPVPQPFDINTADSTQLIALKGIGSKIAARILRFRDDHGGFVSTAQYAEIYGLDSINLAQLTTYARILSPVRKTPINTASAADLDRFPFLSRRQAEVIVNYRNQHGAYTSPESLKAVRILDARTIERLTPYLVF